jgi:hypothetical protein
MLIRGGSVLKGSHEQKIIIKTVAENPGVSIYKIANLTRLHRVTVARHIKGSDFKCKKGLVKDEIIRIERGKRGADLCFLTFKGVLYALNIKAITPIEAAEIRQRNKAKPPPALEGDLADLHELRNQFTYIQKAVLDNLRKRTSAKKFKEIIDFIKREEAKLAEIKNIIAKYKIEEPLLFQIIEKRNSERLYNALLHYVNIIHFDPLIAGSIYHNLMNRYIVEFAYKILFEKDVDLIKELLNVTEKERVGFEIFQKVLIPYLIECPIMPKKSREVLSRLSNCSPDEFCSFLSKMAKKV